MQVINPLLNLLYYKSMFILSPLYLEFGTSRALPLEISSKSRSAQFHLHRAIVSVSSNYNKQIIIWVVTFNAVSSIWRSYYLRLTLYGFPETPFSNHFKTCNPKSIEPNNYKRGNIINYKLNYANKKKEEPAAVWLVVPQAQDKQRFESL